MHSAVNTAREVGQDKWGEDRREIYWRPDRKFNLGSRGKKIKSRSKDQEQEAEEWCPG